MMHLVGIAMYIHELEKERWVYTKPKEEIRSLLGF